MYHCASNPEPLSPLDTLEDAMPVQGVGSALCVPLRGSTISSSWGCTWGTSICQVSQDGFSTISSKIAPSLETGATSGFALDADLPASGTPVLHQAPAVAAIACSATLPPRRLQRSYLPTHSSVSTPGRCLRGPTTQAAAAAISAAPPACAPQPQDCRSADDSLAAACPAQPLPPAQQTEQQQQQQEQELAVGTALPEDPARGLVSGGRRLRVAVKVHSAHMEQLQPSMCAQLASWLLSSGWALTSFAARPGCIELVFDIVNIAEPRLRLGAAADSVSGALAGRRVLRPGCSTPIAGDGSAADAAWAASGLAAWLQQQGLLEPSQEPALLVQVSGHQHVVRWHEGAAGTGPSVVPSAHGDVPLPPAGAWTATPAERLGAPVRPHLTAVPVTANAGGAAGQDQKAQLHIMWLHRSCVVGTPSGCVMLGAFFRHPGAHSFTVRCLGASLPVTTAPQQVVVPGVRGVAITVSGLPRHCGLLLVEARLPLEQQAAAGQSAGAPLAAQGHLCPAVPCLVVDDPAVATELGQLALLMAEALVPVPASGVAGSPVAPPLLQLDPTGEAALAAADEFFLDLGVLLDYRAAALAVEGNASSSSASSSSSITAELQRQLLAQLAPAPAGAGSSGELRQYLADVAATVLAGCVSLGLFATAALVLDTAQVLALCKPEALLRSACDEDEALLEATEASIRHAVLPVVGGSEEVEEVSEQRMPPAGDRLFCLQAPAATEPSPGTPVATLVQQVAPPAAFGAAGCSSAAVHAADESNPAEGEQPTACTAADPELEALLLPEATPGPHQPARRGVCAAVTTLVRRSGAFGFSEPCLEREFWVSTAQQLQGMCRLFALLTAAVTVVSTLRSVHEDGLAGALFMALYQGCQALGMWLIGRYGSPLALFGGSLLCALVRVGGHALLAAGVAPMPALVLPASRIYVDVANECLGKPMLEQLPFHWFAALVLLLDLPAVFFLYLRLNAGQALLTAHPLRRAALYVLLKLGTALLHQLARRRRFLAARSAAGSGSGRRRLKSE